MEFEGCLNDDEKNACMQLLNALPSFKAFPHERKIRLALSQPLSMSLNLIVQHGPCEFSCEGGDLTDCETSKEDHFWPDVSSPFYIENCIPSHNYCVSASIGDCCPVCTETVYMEDFHKEYHYEDGWQWNTELIILSLLFLILLTLSLATSLHNYYNNDSKSTREKSLNIINDPLTQHILEIENSIPKKSVVCLYLKENNVFFLEMVNSIQVFLRGRGFYVIDIYNEEENINRSIARWVQDNIKEENTKILLIETETTHQLWNGVVDGKKVLKPLEQVFYYTRSCVPVTNVHNHLFVVRFQEIDSDTKSFVDLSGGRCYVYPIHRERLAIDLKS